MIVELGHIIELGVGVILKLNVAYEHYIYIYIYRFLIHQEFSIENIIKNK